MHELCWHSALVNNLNRYEIIPGTFAKEDFRARWNGGARHIDDIVIRTIYPECMYTGIHYRIDVDPIGWGNQPLLRGDIIIFRGFANDDIKYVVTWQRSPLICEGQAYVQINAMGKNQEAIESSDADWPTLGFYVPVELCCVISSPTPTIPYDPHARITFVDPFTTHTIASIAQDGLEIQRVKRRDAQVADSPGFLNHLLKRKMSCLSINSDD